MATQQDLVQRLSAPVPRYTSYPTANHFTAKVSALHYVDWLVAIPPDARVSLYAHIPFCRSLCWYCACSTKATRQDDPVRRYVDTLIREIETVADILPAGVRISHMHWGGGSPSILPPDLIGRLAGAFKRAFAVEEDAEFAVEIDPRDIVAEKVDAFRRGGVNRVSFGIQDFDPAVQKAIGREQGFEVTQGAVRQFRAAGIGSINVDIVYGLPRQTLDSLSETLARVVELAPDRIAAFGYAHLPARVRAQRLIDQKTLPDAQQRLAQSTLISATLLGAGYEQIGLDHFARREDALAQAPVRRNFQGYTSDGADLLIGFGASAISKLGDGFAQNAVATRDYERLIALEGLATQRGKALSLDDRVRAFVIERLMCDFEVSAPSLLRQFGEAARPVLTEAAELVDRDMDGLTEMTEDGFGVTVRGRPFVRSICASFDRYLAGGVGQHSAAV